MLSLYPIKFPIANEFLGEPKSELICHNIPILPEPGLAIMNLHKQALVLMVDLAKDG